MTKEQAAWIVRLVAGTPREVAVKLHKGERLVEVAGAGHFLICTHPAELAQIIESWLVETAQPGSATT